MGPASKQAIENYKRRNNGAVPSQIFIYRDGVGDGQIDFVKNFEIPQISAVLNTYGGGLANLKYLSLIKSSVNKNSSNCLSVNSSE